MKRTIAWTLLACCLTANQVFPQEMRSVGTVEIPRVAPFEDADDNFDQNHNMSGLVCPEPSWCLMVSDERRGFHRLKVERDADAMPTVSHDAILKVALPTSEFLSSHGMTGNPKELDLEGIAANADTVVFVGSHANKRKKGEVNPGAHLIAVASLADLKSETEISPRWSSLDALLKRSDMFGTALNKQLQCGGLNIEGATIWDGNLLIGLRAPVRRGGDGSAAYIISTPMSGLETEDFSQAKLHALPTDAELFGIRSLESTADGVLLVTGDAGVNDLPSGVPAQCPENQNPEDFERPFQLRLWKPAEGDQIADEVLATFDKIMDQDFDGETVRGKTEAIAVDPGRPGGLFVLYDGVSTVLYLEDAVPH